MKKVLSLALCLVMTLSLLLPTAVFAEDSNTSTSGMVINKTATANNDDSYTITLEAYGTGDKVTTTVTNEKPTDIVLVLDQSGSMGDNRMGTVSFRSYTSSTNATHYGRRHNGGSANLWHKVGDKYYSVSVTVQTDATYEKITNGKNNSSQNGSINYWKNKDNLYAKVKGEYLKVTVTRSRNLSGYSYTYTLSNGTVIASKSLGNTTSPTFTGTDDGYLYLLTSNTANNVYTYTYTDDNGETQTIGTSTGASTVFGTTLYQRVVDTNSGPTRLQALKDAASAFASSVAEKAKGADGTEGTADDVNHRIAVVGFAHGTTRSTEFAGGYDYVNTELFIGSNEYKYGTSATAQYANAFQDMSTTQGATNVNNSISALSALGATQVDLGMNMAEGILNADSLRDQDRNKVVIVFTDGFPSTYSDYSSDVANNAISKASTLKQAGVTVYAIGVFEGADATSAGNSNGNDTQRANWFLQNLSSNNGTVQNPSYYLSAADSDTLTNIFQQISNQIQSGGSSTTLSSETVIRDIISPAFELPNGTTAQDIELETWHCTGKDGDDYTWSQNSDDAMGAKVTIGSTDDTEAIMTNNNQVNVTGFYFAYNYVGTETVNGRVSYRGNKLVIKFTVTPKDGFLGGNDVYTNTSAGVYENANATQPVLTFDRPQVNVPIKDVTVTASDKDVYLLDGVSADEIKNTTVTVGGVPLDLGAENYGLQSWQSEYVNISVIVKDKDDKEVTALENLTGDNSYTVSVSVTPKTLEPTSTEGTKAETKPNSGAGTVKVYKPVLTFQDSTVYYGDAVPTEFTDNLASTVWKHGDDTANTDTMDEAPELNITYTTEAGKIADGKINTKDDIAVNATVNINTTDVTEYVTFTHSECDGDENCTAPNNGKFWLHVNTCQLTISKMGGADDEPYVFTVYKDNNKKYSEVTIVGNNSETIYELPVGTYSITEDTGWSWRYPNPTHGESVTLNSMDNEGTITCTNSKTKDYWLNGFSDVVKNIFGITN